MAVSSSRTAVPRGAKSKASSLHRLFAQLKSKMMTLEGLFWKIGTATARDRDSVIHRIVALRTPRDAVDDKALDALWFQHLHAAATGAEPPRDEGDAPWTTQAIKAIIKCSCDMQNDLCGKRTLSGISWNGVTRPSRGSLAFPLRTGVSQNLTGLFCRWHLWWVTTSTSLCRIPLRTLCWRRIIGGS